MASRDEEIEVLDLTALRRNKNYLDELMGDISKKGAAQQIAIGGAAGWFSGYLFVKVSKIAACSLGTTIVLIKIAQHQGYLQINWNKVNRHMEKARETLEREANKQYPQLSRQLRRFVHQNMFLAGSFGVGFFLGIVF